MYTILPHIADVRLRVIAEKPESLFASAMRGMAEIQRHGFCDSDAYPVDLEEKIEIQSADVTTLLIDFLSDVLTRSHIARGIFCQVRFEEITPTHLLATISGSGVDATDEDIKAVTYHEAHIHVNSDGLLETMIIFDI